MSQRTVHFNVLLLVQDVLLTMGHVKAVQDVQLIFLCGCAASAEQKGMMHALLPCVAGRLAHCGAVRTWKRAQATARWPQSAGSLSCERLPVKGGGVAILSNLHGVEEKGGRKNFGTFGGASRTPVAEGGGALWQRAVLALEL